MGVWLKKCGGYLVNSYFSRTIIIESERVQYVQCVVDVKKESEDDPSGRSA